MRTDLAHELNKESKSPEGNFVTLFCDELDADKEIAELSDALKQMLAPLKAKSVLVAGLGNMNITPDALGVRTAAKTLATGHFAANPELQEEFRELELRTTYVISPGVMAQTGFETAEQLKLIAKGIKPDCIIAVDSLACNSFERLAKTIQITDTGISPGSGVANNRCEISPKTFGLPVIAIGVPTVIDALLENHAGNDDAPLMLVPRNIDIVINHFSRVIAGAINRVLNPKLSQSEIDNLLMFS